MEQADVGTGALLTGLVGGDHDCWREVLARYRPLVSKAARSIVHSAFDVDDAVQRTWVLLHRHAHGIRDSSRLAGWLKTTVRREALAIAMSRQREILMDDIGGVDTPAGTDVAAEVVSIDEVRRLRAAISSLPATQARLMTALLDDAKTYDHISAELGIARGTIGPTRARAMRTLRALLAARDEAATPDRATAIAC
jgi:RNA polymerase sigma factor (sigma-70 family)